MSKITSDIEELEVAINTFVSRFELVFHEDWQMTQSCVNDENFIHKNGTFINPNIEDEDNNWWNRGGLLKSYRDLCHIMKQKEIRKENPQPDV